MTKTVKPETPALKNVLKDTATIMAGIESVERRGKKLDRDIWVLAASCISHHSKHGDVTLINRLIDAMPKGSRVNALREYFEVLSGASYDENTKKFVHTRGKEAQIDRAMQTPWYSFKQEADYVPVKPLEVLNSVIDRLAKDREKLGDESAVSEELLAALRGVKAEEMNAGIMH